LTLVDIKTTHDQNIHTQPVKQLPVFNNWDVIAKGWYAACRSDQLRHGQLKPFELYGQRLVIFRGEDGAAHALDAYCPHMGTDLAKGAVVGNTVRCFFHHWRFDGGGQCVDVPCQPNAPIPPNAKLSSYATCERYGYVWVWPEASAPEPVVEFPQLAGEELVVWHDQPIERNCHHHVGMINGIDAQHLRTVHQLDVEMKLHTSEHQDGRVVDFVLTGELPKSFAGRALRRLIGDKYSYGMRYADGCVGLLTTMKDLRLGGTGVRLPELYMVYAYTPVDRGKVTVQPIFVTKKRKGVVGWLYSRALLIMTWRGYRSLQGEDGMVYDKMRFAPNAMLPIDAPVAKFIAYVNRLKPSVWSRVRPADSAR
jgi:phenylpropionate dioxygenase-like ring-hydroxylating dioxygenase large terminal subunit